MIKLPKRRKQAKPEHKQLPVEEPTDDGHELRMGFFDHLDELRRRFMWAFASLVIGTAVGLSIAPNVLVYLLKPYADLYPDGAARLVVLGPTGAVVSYFRVSLLVGGILAIPMITYQVLLFVIPGLTRKEKRYLLGSILPITMLFLVGVAFSWFILMPPAISFLEGFESDIFDPEWTADQYLSFVTSLLFWMGVAFETPLVFFVLAVLGFVTAGNLIRNWRIAVIATAVAAALITPTIDPINMFLVMGPLLTLYLVSILLVIIGRRISGVKG